MTRRAFAPLGGLAIALVIGGCAAPANRAVASVPHVATLSDVRTMIDDRTTGIALDRFHYSGRWQSVTGRADGRTLGTSTRSFHHGDIASLSFIGTQVRLYGVIGPKGGDARISVDGNRDVRTARFRAAAFGSNVLVYASPPLGEGEHTLTIFTTGNDGASGGGGFVNVDGAVISHATRLGL